MMTAFMILPILCGFLLTKVCIAEQPVQNISESVLNSARSISTEMKETNDNDGNVKSYLQDSASSSYLAILSSCTNLPFTYNKLLEMYLKSTNSPDEVQRLQDEIRQLKKESEILIEQVNLYTELVQKIDENANQVRERMATGTKNLLNSLNILYENVYKNPQTSRIDKVTFLQDNIKPSILRFEEECLFQTRDILNNVLQNLDIP